MASRHVLTTNQVIEIMLKYLETQDWEKAFMSEIPQRKMPLLASSTEGSRDGEEPPDTQDNAKQDTVVEDDAAPNMKSVDKNMD
jgi:tRNA (guanine9-N1)-methyltransferase